MLPSPRKPPAPWAATRGRGHPLGGTAAAARALTGCTRPSCPCSGSPGYTVSGGGSHPASAEKHSEHGWRPSSRCTAPSPACGRTSTPPAGPASRGCAERGPPCATVSPPRTQGQVPRSVTWWRQTHGPQASPPSRALDHSVCAQLGGCGVHVRDAGLEPPASGPHGGASRETGPVEHHHDLEGGQRPGWPGETRGGRGREAGGVGAAGGRGDRPGVRRHPGRLGGHRASVLPLAAKRRFWLFLQPRMCPASCSGRRGGGEPKVSAAFRGGLRSEPRAKGTAAPWPATNGAGRQGARPCGGLGSKGHGPPAEGTPRCILTSGFHSRRAGGPA